MVNAVKNHIVSIIAFSISLILLMTVVADVFQSEPLVIEEVIGEASIYIETSHSRTLFPGDCIEVLWRVEGIRGIYFLGQPTVGEASQNLCIDDPVIDIELADNTAISYSPTPSVLVRDTGFLSRFGGAALGILVGFAALGWFGNYRAIGKDVRLLWQDFCGFFVELKSSGRQHLLLLTLIMVVGGGIRIWFMQREVIGDEVETFMRYTWDFGTAITLYDFPNNHIFNTIFVFLERQIFGYWVAGWRLHNLVFGISAIFMSYVIGRLLYTKAVGLWTATFVAISTPMIIYSALARGYITQAFLALGLMLIGHYLIKRSNIVAWLLWSVCAALCFYTLPTTVMVYAGVGSWVMFNLLAGEHGFKCFAEFIAYTTLAAIMTLALYLPVFRAVGIQPIINNSFVPPPLTDDNLFGIYLQHAINTGKTWTSDWHPVLVYALLICLLVSLVAMWRSKSSTRFPIQLFLLGAAIAYLVAEQTTPYTRVWLYMMPVFGMQAAIGATWLIKRVPQTPRQYATIISTGIVITIGIVSVVVAYYGIVTTREHRDILRYIDSVSESPEDTRIISYQPDTLKLFYHLHVLNMDTTYILYDAYEAENYYLVTSGFNTFDFIINAHTRIDASQLSWREVASYETLTLYELQTPLPFR